MIASHLDLINIDLELAQELGGASLKQNKKNFLKVHRRLKEGIQELQNSSIYDFVFIDCPPNFNIVTKTAIVASSHLLIPARPDYLSTIGIDYLIRQHKKLVRDYNEYIGFDNHQSDEEIFPRILGVIFNMVQLYSGKPISASRLTIQQTKKLGLYVFERYIRENKTLHSEAVQYGVPLALKGFTGSSTEKYVIEEIEAFVDEFENQIEEKEAFDDIFE
ncbi:cobyrinic acid a,c-diamide synthase [Candidatus Magnetomorum sp. HK-1]|nr:cobyrinic acid a,c-diamide synthase [Candidatus Magnetomorum sp. HK-1]